MTVKNATLNKRALTAVPDINDIRDRYYEPSLIQLKRTLKPSGIPVILDQGVEGACTGFGLAAVINYLNAKRGSRVKVSPRMLYEMARKFDEWPGDEYSGSSCRGAIKGWYNNGVCEEKLWPYKSNDRTSLTVKQAKNAKSHTIGAYYRLRHDIVDFHTALNEAGVVFVSANVHSGWDQVDKNGKIPYSEEKLGGHAFAIVGYDDHGFWIQNSWGKTWGQGGLALWTYEDWLQNITDGWVLSLGLSTPQIWEQRQKAGSALKERSGASKPERGQIAGHFVHIDNGHYLDSGKYWSNDADVAQTAGLLKDSNNYDHLLLYAHGGLNTEVDSAVRVRAFKEVFKENRIYPFHFMYSTGLMQELGDVIAGKAPETIERVGGFSDWSDKLVEKAARSMGMAVWNEMKSGAFKPFVGDGSGIDILRHMIFAATKRKKPLKIHIAGHSTGAIFMAHLLTHMQAEYNGVKIDTASLLAPACSNKLFKQVYHPAVKSTIRDMALYNLSDELELDDQVAGIYRKSLLYLVSNSFEEVRGEAIAGLQKFNKEITTKGIKIHYSSGDRKGQANPVTQSTSHGGFDNDVATMNHILFRIFLPSGIKPKRLFTAKDLDY